MTEQSVAALVAGLQKIVDQDDDPRRIVDRVAPLARAMATDVDWIEAAFYEAGEDQGFGITILHAEPGDGLFVETVSWLPGRGVAPMTIRPGGSSSALMAARPISPGAVSTTARYRATRMSRRTPRW